MQKCFSNRSKTFLISCMMLCKKDYERNSDTSVVSACNSRGKYATAIKTAIARPGARDSSPWEAGARSGSGEAQERMRRLRR